MAKEGKAFKTSASFPAWQGEWIIKEADTGHAGSVSDLLQALVRAEIERRKVPQPQSKRIIEDLVGYLAPADRDDVVELLDRLHLRDEQPKLLARLLVAYFAHLGELADAGEDPRHLTTLGLYVCRARDFFRPERRQEERPLMVADPPAPPLTKADVAREILSQRPSDPARETPPSAPGAPGKERKVR